MGFRVHTKRKSGGHSSGFILLFLGGIFLAVGLLVRSMMGPYDGGVSTDGQVVSIEQYRDRSSGRMYRVVVEFTDPATGETHQVTGSAGSSQRPTVGDSREISFPPGQPHRARVIELTWLPWIFLGVGALLSLFGVIFVATFVVKAAVLIGAMISGDKNQTGAASSIPGPTAPDVPRTRPPANDLGATITGSTPPSPFSGKRSEPSAAVPGTGIGEPAPAAQWYPDPADPNQLRWWDGERWTDHTHPR